VAGAKEQDGLADDDRSFEDEVAEHGRSYGQRFPEEVHGLKQEASDAAVAHDYHSSEVALGLLLAAQLAAFEED